MPLTPFALLCDLAGLSQKEAGEFLKISPSSIDKMRRGVRSTPPGTLNDLKRLIALQERSAAEALRIVRGADAEEVEIGYPADDDEAREAFGFPNVGAWSAMAARVLAASDRPINLVPHGSAPAPAGAARAKSVQGAKT